MQWYYSKAGAQHGPVTEDELRAKTAAGEVGPADLVWKEGMRDWIPASQAAALKAASPADGVGASPYAPPAGPYRSPTGPPVPNYLWQSIVLILLCWPVGIPAVVYASKVDGLLAQGDLGGAAAASATAKTWCWVGYGGYLAMLLVAVMFFLVMLLSAIAS